MVIAALLRFIVPIVLIYFIVKFFKKKVYELTGMADNLVQGSANKQDDNVIEICPDCGYEKGARHRCKRS